MELKEKLLSTKCFYDNEFLDKYIDIVSCADVGDYVESHHIIPKSYYKLHNLDVDNSSSNRVTLSVYNHLLAHYYMYYSTSDLELKNKLAAAFVYMKNGQQGQLLTLEENEFIESLPRYVELRNTNYWKGRKRSEENREAVRMAQYNRSPELQDKMTASLKGRKVTEEQRRKMSEAQRRRDPTTFKGPEMTPERRQRLREANLGKKQSEETKQKRKESLSKLKWYNNGVESVRSEVCPEGYVEGRLSYMTDEMKNKCSQKGKHWYTNGIVNTMAVECPAGFWLGKISRTVSE